MEAERIVRATGKSAASTGRLAAVLLGVLLAWGSGDPWSGPAAQAVTEESSGTPVQQPSGFVELDPGQARRRGAAQYRCWGDDCWWVVWCGHAVCDGSWRWKDFPASGSFRFVWKGVNKKCAGSPPYRLEIDGRTVAAGEVPQYGSCDDCARRRGYGVYEDISLGTHTLRKGSRISLWAETEFLCGIDGPGAYAAHDTLLAVPVDRK